MESLAAAGMVFWVAVAVWTLPTGNHVASVVHNQNGLIIYQTYPACEAARHNGSIPSWEVCVQLTVPPRVP